MSKTWSISEKIIGIILTLWGMLVLYTVTNTVYNTYFGGTGASMIKTGNTSYLFVFKKNHLSFFLGLVTLYAGFNLLFYSKPGWIICLIASFMYAYLLLTSASGSQKHIAQQIVKTNYGYLAAGLCALAIFILLLQKPFRIKYKAVTRDWIIIVGVILLLLLDHAIF